MHSRSIHRLLLTLSLGLISSDSFAITLWGNSFNNFGAFRDQESHLLYLNARYLHLGIDRFISRDHYTFLWNLYGYVSDGNPINDTDPSGHLRTFALGDGCVLTSCSQGFGDLTSSVAINAITQVQESADSFFGDEIGVDPDTMIRPFERPRPRLAPHDNSQIDYDVRHVANNVIERVTNSGSYDSNDQNRIKLVLPQRRQTYEQHSVAHQVALDQIEIARDGLRQKLLTLDQYVTRVEETGCGNCLEQSRVVAYHLRARGIDARPAENFRIDHVIVKIYDPEGKLYAISDPWAGQPLIRHHEDLQLYGNLDDYEEENE